MNRRDPAGARGEEPDAFFGCEDWICCLMEFGGRRAERAAYDEDERARRNGYRERTWQTRAGRIELRLPTLRKGSYFTGFLQPRHDQKGAHRRGSPAIIS
jgi:hypothetical protein